MPAGDVVVGRVGKAHGLRGEVSVLARTDAPRERFVPGAVFAAVSAAGDPGGLLTLRTVRVHNAVLLLGFEGIEDRNAAERLRGVLLHAPASDGARDPNTFYEADLVGLAVLTTEGERVGEVSGLEMRPAQDLLLIRLTDGAQARVPFVQAMVPTVDIEGGQVVIDPPEGLLELGRD